MIYFDLNMMIYRKHTCGIPNLLDKSSEKKDRNLDGRNSLVLGELSDFPQIYDLSYISTQSIHHFTSAQNTDFKYTL